MKKEFEKMFKVSIIIPVYNAEDYLKNTIGSVINQTIGFENIELILVDDCSKDSSREIILDYSNKYDNVVPIFAENNHGIASYGRNVGIENASAEYVMFLDNDDFLDSDLCRTLYDLIIKENADLSCCNRVIDDGKSEVSYSFNKNITEGKEYLILENDDVVTFNNILVHGKLFKRSVLIENNLRFHEDKTSEDFIFCTECFLHFKKVVYLDRYYGYRWMIVDSSISHTNDEYMVGNIDASRYLFNQLKKENKEQYAPTIFKFTLSVIFRYCFTLKDNNEIKKVLKKLYDFEEELNFSIEKDLLYINIINFFVIRKHFTIATVLIKIMGAMSRNNFIKKIYRVFGASS